ACPECGAAIAESLRTDTLAAANPQWRRRIRWGIVVLAASPVPAVASAFLRHLTFPWFLGMWVSLPLGFKLDPLQGTLTQYGYAWVLTALTALLSAAGTWLLAAPWPWPAREPQWRRRVL